MNGEAISRHRTVQQRLGERVRELRAGRGLTQLRLAERSGISRPSIANVEAGRQNVSLRQLCALATALGVTAAELLSGPDRP
ncbi:MAG TPA: helix-turn-helix transcriptional regulator [Candidatus Elarobacter sp.]|nr:helix-turn-helix transcriptional regulator [Candidatus Elarobacter sp.]